MKQLLLFLVTALFLFANFSLKPSERPGYLETGFGVVRVVAAEADAEAVLRAIYAQYGPGGAFFDVAGTYFSPELEALYRAVEEGASEDYEYALDFDIFVDAQDFDPITDLATEIRSSDGERAVVEATFTNFGRPTTMVYSFVATPEGWRVDNLSWGPDRPDLRAHLEDLLARQAAR